MFNYMGMNVQQVKDAVGGRKVIDQEYVHAQESIQTGIYITYACAQKRSECGRIGSTSKCFCGHLFGAHKQILNGKKFNTSCEQCICKQYKFVPSRPEECGMYWLVRRKDFNVTKWRPPCKCKHTCEEHSPNYPLKCRLCNCQDFNSYFACISCDQVWELHEVLYESDQERLQMKKPIGKAYLPLSQNLDIQQEVFKDNKYELDQFTNGNFQQQAIEYKPQDGNSKPFPIKKLPPQPKNQIALKQEQYTTAYTRPRPQSMNKVQKPKK